MSLSPCLHDLSPQSGGTSRYLSKAVSGRCSGLQYLTEYSDYVPHLAAEEALVGHSRRCSCFSTSPFHWLHFASHSSVMSVTLIWKMYTHVLDPRSRLGAHSAVHWDRIQRSDAASLDWPKYYSTMETDRIHRLPIMRQLSCGFMEVLFQNQPHRD